MPSVPNTFCAAGNRTRDLCSLPDDATHLTIQPPPVGELGGHSAAAPTAMSFTSRYVVDCRGTQSTYLFVIKCAYLYIIH